VFLEDDQDWKEIRELVTDSYRILAPKKLAALLDENRRSGTRARKWCRNPGGLKRSSRNRHADLQGLRGAGATGLEPATSGVTAARITCKSHVFAGPVLSLDRSRHA
jgi:hypothetical protein